MLEPAGSVDLQVISIQVKDNIGMSRASGVGADFRMFHWGQSWVILTKASQGCKNALASAVDMSTKGQALVAACKVLRCW